MPSRIKKPDQVFGAGGWLEWFQLAYGISEIVHKNKMRNLAGQKYASTAMDSVYAEYKAQPFNPDVIDSTIDNYEKIMSNLYWDKDSPHAIKAIGQLDTLKEKMFSINLFNTFICYNFNF